ncbi:hypothetical protein FHG87_024409 [Trinorchestia longiramus]|nr:hypothetical protein FHG87_024409 [Trinorchestia longiramus]
MPHTQALPNTLEEGEEFGKHLSCSDYWNCTPRRRATQLPVHMDNCAPSEEELEPGEVVHSNMEQENPEFGAKIRKQIPKASDKFSSVEAKEFEMRNLLESPSTAQAF